MIDTPISDGTRQPLAPAVEPTLTELVSGIADDAQRLLVQQYQMLRAEIREDVRRTKSAIAYLSFGAAASAVGAIFLVIALPLLINWGFDLAPWAGWAIMGGVLLVVGLIGLFAGKRIFEKNNPLPDKTLNALEENIFMDRESPELIEREMEQTRESLTEKVSLLEQKVVGQIQSATDTVQGTVTSIGDTVQSVKDAVTDTVQCVTESVKTSVESIADNMKETLDMRKQVREHPLAMVGGAAAAGFITGLLVFRRPHSAVPAPAFTPMPSSGYVPAYAAAPARSGWLSDLLDVAIREVKTIAERALASTTAKLKQSVETGIPKLIETALPDVAGRTGAESTTPVHRGNGAFPFAGERH